MSILVKDERRAGGTPALRSKGSVLVFAVLVLAILAMLTTAFLIVAKHALQASKSTTNSMQADLAALSAQHRLSGGLHTAVKGQYTYSPMGVVGVDNTGALSLISTTSAQNAGPTNSSTVQFLEHDPGFDIQNNIQTPAFAVLSTHYPDTRYENTVTGLPTTPFYTSAPLRINAYAVGSDRAQVYFMQANMSDFFNGVDTHVRKPLPVPGTIRGQHFVWVRDLDSNFYAIPAMWGLNTKNISNNNNVSETLLAQRILEYLRTTPASQMQQYMDAGDPAYIASLPAYDANNKLITYDNIGAFAMLFPGYEANAAAYPFWRADIEAYFTTYLDAAKNADGTYATNSQNALVSQFKPHPAAININMAPEEVIQAMFSQIPYDDTHTFATYKPQGSTLYYSELIAKRIVAKRPFLCRMDFEDFCASLLPGDPTEPLTVPTATSAQMSPVTPVGIVRYAIAKRIDREIRLSQFMEMPGLPDGDYVDTKGAFVDTNPYKNSNTALQMANRFSYFILDDPASTAPTRAQCVLTVKAFNNFLNSVSSSPGPSYKGIQKIVPGTTASANALEIDANGGSLDGIPLGGDDQYIRDPLTNKITGISTGANGIAETEIVGFSYYSHDYGGKVPNEYKPARLLSDPNYATLNPNSPADCGKFVYGDPTQSYAPLTSQNAQPSPDGVPQGYKNYFIADLQKWSCVGDGIMSGYYDMFFNATDGMKYDFAEKSTAMPMPSETDVGVMSANGTALRTGLKSDDIQEVDFGSPLDDENFVVVLPGPNLKIETEPNKNNSTLAQTPGQPPAQPQGDDMIVNAIRLSLWQGDPGTYNGDVYYTSTGDAYWYLVPARGTTTLKSAPRPPDPTNPDPTDNDVLVQVIVDGGDGKSDTQIENDDVLDPVNNVITVGPNLVNETVVWGPLRGSQRAQDIALPINADQKPTASLTNPVSGNNGDVAWSPPICFRSRYFGAYVLAQGLNTQQKAFGTVSGAQPVGANVINFTCSDPSVDLTQVLSPGVLFAVNTVPTGHVESVTHVYMVESFTGTSSAATIVLNTPITAPINAGDPAKIYWKQVAGERRNEFNLDGYNDEILWSRTPLTDKRALGDPP